MQPRAKDYVRAARSVDAALQRNAVTPDAVIREFLSASWDLLGTSSSCWHQTDPASGLPVSSAVAGEPPGSLEWSLEFEYARPDVSRFSDLSERRSPVAAISTETGGARSSSARFREMIQPAGAADELRVAFRDPYGIWATLVVFTTRRMTAEDLNLVSAAVPLGTAALRAATAHAALAAPAAACAPDPGGPSVLILDAGDGVIAADATSRARLSVLPEERAVTIPGVVSVLAAQARSGRAGARASARMRGLDGRWLELDASALEDDPGSVAVVIQPAAPDRIRDTVWRALGLTARERQIALRSAHGQSAKEIARELQISPWTVQDHLKAVYAKTGVNSRSGLSALAWPSAA